MNIDISASNDEIIFVCFRHCLLAGMTINTFLFRRDLLRSRVVFYREHTCLFQNISTVLEPGSLQDLPGFAIITIKAAS